MAGALRSKGENDKSRRQRSKYWKDYKGLINYAKVFGGGATRQVKIWNWHNLSYVLHDYDYFVKRLECSMASMQTVKQQTMRGYSVVQMRDYDSIRGMRNGWIQSMF